MNISLYVLADKFLQAAERLSDLELDEQTIADTLEGLEGEIQIKATNCVMFAKGCRAEADAIGEAIKAMQSRQKAKYRRADAVEQYVLDNMLRTGISKIESPYFALSVRDNPPSVVIDDAMGIPAEFMRQPETPPPMPDKALIKAALNANPLICWAHLERGKRLDIK
jgi:hypothetical protein